MKKWISIFIVFLLFPCFISAGDIASFVNLGFSDDSRFVMFGQFGIDETSSYAYADIFIVDVARNEFVPYGVKSKKYNIIPEPGNNGIGALYNLIEENYNLTKKCNINHLLTGRFLYILVDGETPKKDLEFRDFNTGIIYHVSLKQTTTGSGKQVSSSFHIETSVIKESGKSTTSTSYTIGRPFYMRSGVKEYQIKYILLSPDKKSLVFIVEKIMVDTKGSNVRYMIETKRL